MAGVVVNRCTSLWPLRSDKHIGFRDPISLFLSTVVHSVDQADVYGMLGVAWLGRIGIGFQPRLAYKR